MFLQRMLSKKKQNWYLNYVFFSFHFFYFFNANKVKCSSHIVTSNNDLFIFQKMSIDHPLDVAEWDKLIVQRKIFIVGNEDHWIKTDQWINRKTIDVYGESHLLSKAIYLVYNKLQNDKEQKLVKKCNHKDCLNPNHHSLENRRKLVKTPREWIEEDYIKLGNKLRGHYLIQDNHWIISDRSKTITMKGMYFSLPRAAYITYHKEIIPSNLVMRRNCDEQNCINPEHYLAMTIGLKSSEWIDADWERLDKRLKQSSTVEKNGCVISTNYKNKQGYHNMHFHGITGSAHRFAIRLKLKQVDLDPNLQVRHLCGNRNCINQDHLALGTRQDNAADKIAHGTSKRGEDAPNTMISNELALQIYQSKGKGTKKERALRFQVSENAIADIDCGKSWSWLTNHARPAYLKSKKPTQDINQLTLQQKLDARKYIEDRVRKETDIEGEHWIWTLSVDNGGYGKASFINLSLTSHRLSYIAFISSVEEGMIVRHKCKHKLCCAPDHLQTGTYKENNLDDRIRDGNIKRGELNHSTKISEHIAKKIKVSKGEGTQKERARKFGVALSTVTAIDRGGSWGYLVLSPDELETMED